MSRLPNKQSDLLDTTSFKIAITMRYNLKWEADEELNKHFRAYHKEHTDLIAKRSLDADSAYLTP